MRFILFLYLLIVDFANANADRYYPLRKPALPFRSAAPLRSAPPFKNPAQPFGSAAPFKNPAMLSHQPFPSLPAAIHYQDSADIWRKSLGAAKTGGAIPLPSGSAIPKLKIHSNMPIKMKEEPLTAVNYYKKKFLRGG